MKKRSATWLLYVILTFLILSIFACSSKIVNVKKGSEKPRYTPTKTIHLK